MRHVFLFLFFAVSAGEVVSLLNHNDWLHHLCKPLLMVTLCGHYLMKARWKSMLVVVALAFSFVGDSILMYQAKNPLYFILGLAAFLLAHICYIFAYRQHRATNRGDNLQNIQKARMAFPVVLAGTGLVVVLQPALGNLMWPVTVYAGVLVIMVLTAIFRFQLTSEKSFWLVLIGALLFMLSDSLLAVDKFLHQLDNAPIWIMTTYIAGQWLIIEGLISHNE
jgi:uncharacterized membrane protein YhhN